ncbi:hypothetical protein V5O48_017061 [Marasmius crinis-equi]|uniref:Uncharacterized protein n=1 Tax=Marasmius crinis-equi TaxID=585013 RepID=A0ABR3EQ07_9AGAR
MQLWELESAINEELAGSGSQYLERLYREWVAWKHVDSGLPSPLEIPYKLFNSMLDCVAKIGNGILNEFGAYKEWKECWRLTRRIREIFYCIDDLEMAVLEGEGSTQVLEDRYAQGKLSFQGNLTRAWVDREVCATYIPLLDKVENPPPPPGQLFF